MNKVYQTDISPFTGNCFAAAIASVFEIPITEAFDNWDRTVEPPVAKKDWIPAFIEWAKSKGKTVVWTNQRDFDFNLLWFRDRAMLYFYKNLSEQDSEKKEIAHFIAADYTTGEIHNPTPGIDNIRFWTLNYEFKWAFLVI